MKPHPPIVLFVVCAAALAGCQTPSTPQEQEAMAAKQCQTFRSYLPARAYVDVLESCTRQLGEKYCRQCLAQ